MITVTLGKWVSHSNLLLSAALYFEDRHRERVEFRCATDGPPNATLVVEANGKRALCDYNDTYQREASDGIDLYAKRSLTAEDVARGVWPLGFHFNYAYSLHRLLRRPGFVARRNAIEIQRALDVLQLSTGSHFARRIEQWFRPPEDHGGRAIFYTRLWDPDRNRDPDEKERRRKMNRVRIDAVRALRAMPNTAAGIYPTPDAISACPDLVLTHAEMRSKAYGEVLRGADIGIANEGLKGSPGWKIGEYVAGSKAIVTNAIECVIPDFERGRHYAEFDDVAAVPDLVADLRRNHGYRAMQEANWEYTRRYLHPDVYFERLLTRLAA